MQPNIYTLWCWKDNFTKSIDVFSEILINYAMGNIGKEHLGSNTVIPSKMKCRVFFTWKNHLQRGQKFCFYLSEKGFFVNFPVKWLRFSASPTPNSASLSTIFCTVK